MLDVRVAFMEEDGIWREGGCTGGAADAVARVRDWCGLDDRTPHRILDVRVYGEQPGAWAYECLGSLDERAVPDDMPAVPLAGALDEASAESPFLVESRRIDSAGRNEAPSYHVLDGRLGAGRPEWGVAEVGSVWDVLESCDMKQGVAVARVGGGGAPTFVVAGQSYCLAEGAADVVTTVVEARRLTEAGASRLLEGSVPWAGRADALYDVFHDPEAVEPAPGVAQAARASWERDLERMEEADLSHPSDAHSLDVSPLRWGDGR